VSRTRQWIPLITVVVLLGAAMITAIHAPLPLEPVPTSRPTGQPPAPAEATPEPFEPMPTTSAPQSDPVLPAWVGTLLTVLCGAAVIALVIALLWLVLRDRLLERKSVPEVADAEEVRRLVRERLRAAVDEGLSDLDVADADPRRAVIACWARLEAAAAAAGTQREPGDTSTELVERLLAEHAITPGVLAGFAAVYREARFAPHVIDARMREQARAALRQVRDELVREATAEPSASAPAEPAASAPAGSAS
jgi:Domain of unknown function (DUF4129)